jgi:hypothetical protein
MQPVLIVTCETVNSVYIHVRLIFLIPLMDIGGISELIRDAQVNKGAYFAACRGDGVEG